MQTFENPLAEGFNLTVTGFMGTGKSTVASILAERLGRQLVDMDERIEAELGKTIAQVFAKTARRFSGRRKRGSARRWRTAIPVWYRYRGGTLGAMRNWQGWKLRPRLCCSEALRSLSESDIRRSPSAAW